MQPAPDKLDVKSAALFLDVDGTLLPIRDNPAEVVARNGLVQLLEQCAARLDGALALVSGRSIAEVDRIFAPVEFPAAGAHGAELRYGDGRIVMVAETRLPQHALASLQSFAGSHDGLLLEDKGSGVSLHYRRAPALESACRQCMEQLLDELGDTFRLIAGKMVFEIAPAAHNKGAAINRLLESGSFVGRRPVFIGDDVTDEDGFRAVNARGGVSIRVGEGSSSAAHHELAAVEDVSPWLRNAILVPPVTAYNGESR
ncbi:MAG: trehalose-phosphatase [Woeseiaceae bacterium]